MRTASHNNIYSDVSNRYFDFKILFIKNIIKMMIMDLGFCWASSRRHAEAPCEQHCLYHQHQNITVAQWGNSHHFVQSFNQLSSRISRLRWAYLAPITTSTRRRPMRAGWRRTSTWRWTQIIIVYYWPSSFLLKVDYSDIFISPWCCDSSHEDRYEALVQQMRELELDPTTVVLLSVMSLFYISQSQASSSLAASSTIASHQRKFSLLLQR